MKKVLCFGDSNTYGFVPETRLRYNKNLRWTGILKQLAEDEYEIVEAGCNNRTAFAPNPYGEFFIGNKILPKLLDSTFDVVHLSLGINDIQKAYNSSLEEVRDGIINLINITQEICPTCKIILVAPAKIGSQVLNHKLFSTLFDENSIKKSLNYSKMYKELAEEKNCLFIDWDKLVTVSNIDGLHFSADGHRTIAEYTYKFLQHNI